MGRGKLLMKSTSVNSKFFGEMSLDEVTDVLLKLKMPDGTKVDPETAKASLARTTPMLKDRLYQYKLVLKDISPEYIKTNEIFREWKKTCDELEDTIKRCDKVLDSTLVTV